MATETTNLKLAKPDKTDFYDISVHNENMDKIDQEFGKKADKTDIPSIPSSLPANGGNADTIDGKHAIDFNPYAGISPRIVLTQGTISDAVLNQYNNDYRQGTIVLNGYSASDTYKGCSWGTVHWFCDGASIFHLSFYQDRIETFGIRSICPSENLDTGWKAVNDGGNADTVDGASRFNLLQHYQLGNGIDITSTVLNQPYSTNINETLGQSIGLENSWWHLLYLPHSDGYGMQIAFPLNTSAYRPKYRISYNLTWQSWRLLNDNTYVQSSAPSSPQTNDLWIW